ncbi:MAG: Asp-tRNA(Asn)/Glu-tRNA(Gln) amidotransferase subunit GatB, partial [Halomonas sp.]
AYMRKLHTLVRYLEICDGNMQEGSFRCDANVSVRPVGQEAFGTRAELKNLNSFRFVERALAYEVERQIDLLESGGEVVQETRLYDVDQGVTRSMRTKEEANDYRYFPEPDLLPVALDSAFIEATRETLPELPDEKRRRFQEEHGLPAYDAGVLTTSRELAEFYEHAVSESGGFAKRTANLLMSELLAYLNKDGLEITASPVTPEMLGKLVTRLEDGTISSRGAKDAFEAMWAGEGEPDEVIERRGLKQVTDTAAIEAMIDEVLANNPQQLEQYRAGKEKLFGFFVGQVMKASGGTANPQQVNELLKQKLEAS